MIKWKVNELKKLVGFVEFVKREDDRLLGVRNAVAWALLLDQAFSWTWLQNGWTKKYYFDW